MNKGSLNKNELDALFSVIEGAQHILHLYSPSINKYLIHASFFSNKKTAYVTAEDSNSIVKKFNPLKVDLLVVSPNEINQAMNCERIIIDAASINLEIKSGEENYLDHYKREDYLSENFKKQSILCTYDITKLDPKKIKILVEKHDKLILSTDNTTLLSSKSLLTKKLINSKLIDEFVKKELRTIVLALINRKAMCGRDIKLEIYKTFNILLSSGTLYPLLHELEKNGLIECRIDIKTKMYSPANEGEINKILNEHIQVKNFLSNFLQSSMIKEI